MDEELEHLAYLLTLLIQTVDPQTNRGVTYEVIAEMLTADQVDERDIARFGKLIRAARRDGSSDPHIH